MSMADFAVVLHFFSALLRPKAKADMPPLLEELILSREVCEILAYGSLHVAVCFKLTPGCIQAFSGVRARVSLFHLPV